MQESITIADVGDMVNVSGSRIATPLAPPRPGSTPMSTPRVMPTNIRPMFIGVRTTTKPCSNEFSASIRTCSGEADDQLAAAPTRREDLEGSVAEECQGLQRALVER